MTVTVESFHVAGTKVGALVRKLSPVGLETLNCLLVPDGPMVELRHVFECGEDVFEWTRFRYSDAAGTIQIGERRGTNVVVDGQVLEAVSDRVIPSYASWLLLQEMVEDGLRELEFHLINEGGSDPAMVPATLRSDGSAGTVLLLENDKPRNTFWVEDGRIVRSDWGGAESYAVDDVDTALDGLSGGVAATVRAFL